MQIDKKRLSKQKKIVQRWVENKGKGTIVGPTGFGKSFISILTIQSMNKRHPDRTTIIIVPTHELQKQWNENIKEHGLQNTKVLIINTAIKRELSCHLLVLDEIHRYAADTFKEVFSRISYKFIQGLTATFEREDNKHYLLERVCPVIFRMDVKEAKKNEYISDFKVYNLGVQMNVSDKILYDDLNQKFNYYFSWFEFDFHRAKLCLKDRLYINHYAARMKSTPEEVKVKAINFFRVMGQRKAFLYNNSSKLSIVKRIIDGYPMKAIIFSETTGFADVITKILGEKCRSAHTQIPSKERDKILEEYAKQDSDISVLSTAKMFDEGINLPEIQMALIASGTSSKRQTIQRVGRALRKREDKVALIINLYMVGTQEEKWVDKRTAGLSPHWIRSYEDIDDEGVSYSGMLNYNTSLFG